MVFTVMNTMMIHSWNLVDLSVHSYVFTVLWLSADEN